MRHGKGCNSQHTRSLHCRWFPKDLCHLKMLPRFSTKQSCVQLIECSGHDLKSFCVTSWFLYLILFGTTKQFEGLNFCCIRGSQSQSLLCQVRGSYILNWKGNSIVKLRAIYLRLSSTWHLIPYDCIWCVVSSRSSTPCYHCCPPSCSIVRWIHEGIAHFRTTGRTSTKTEKTRKQRRN